MAVIVGKHLLVQGGYNEKGTKTNSVYALILKDFTWIDVHYEGEGPGFVSDHCAVSVFHSKHSGPEFGLFKWPDKHKKINLPMKYEGVYVFGGMNDKGYSTNELWVLRTGRPIP